MRRAWSYITLLVAAPVLGSCALPPAVTIASYSADIVSYAATGKTLTDHVYSAVARSDCAFIRVFEDRTICVDASKKTTTPKAVAIASARPLRRTRMAAPAVEAHASSPRRRTYVALGSFLDERNAERTRARYAAFHPRISAALVHGRHFHRVVAGPLSQHEAALLKEKLIAAEATLKAARG